MVHPPHNYEVIFELSLKNLHGSETLDAYKNSKENGKTFFTLLPEKMDLTDLIRGEKKAFQAVLFQGHFEKDGKPLGPVLVYVEKLVYAEELEIH
jgi:hypothetical protein